jgi:O-succinylbenzoate synthase
MTKSFELHRYSLQPANGGLARKGALLRHDGGFADLHPWPELDDQPLDKQIEALRRHVQTGEAPATPLLARSLVCLRQDAEARRAGRSLFAGLPLPENHRLWPDFHAWKPDEIRAEAEAAAKAGFRTLKLKCGRHPEAEHERLEQLAQLDLSFKLRIDMNARLDADEFHAFIHAFSSRLLDALDYVEDPCPWEPLAWRGFQERYGLRLASDRCTHAGLVEDLVEGFETYIVKPAAQDPARFVKAAALHMKRLVITSYLDHPVGQAFALLEAARVLDQHPLLLDTCGLASHDAYHPNEFSMVLKMDGARLLAPEGTGLGFDAQLDRLSWLPL